MKKIIPIILILLFGCRENRIIYEDPPAIAAGNVYSLDSGIPLCSAWVCTDTLSRDASLTDSNGYYSYPLGMGSNANKAIYCGKQGYVSQVKVISYVAPDTVTVNFNLVPE